MKEIVLALTACLFLGAGATLATAQDTASQDPAYQNAKPAIESSAAVTRTATVQAVDYENRTVTLKGQDGKVFTVKVGPEARNFDQIRKGDRVTFRREEALALSLQRANEPATSGQEQTFLRAPAGQKPSGTLVSTTRITATVEKINRDKGELILRGPKGQTQTLKVQSAKALEQLKPGDQVTATYTETYIVNVVAPK